MGVFYVFLLFKLLSLSIPNDGKARVKNTKRALTSFESILKMFPYHEFVSICFQSFSQFRAWQSPLNHIDQKAFVALEWASEKKCWQFQSKKLEMWSLQGMTRKKQKKGDHNLSHVATVSGRFKLLEAVDLWLGLCGSQINIDLFHFLRRDLCN